MTSTRGNKVRDHIDAIEEACRALADGASPAVAMTCQEILERCFLLRWYDGDEPSAVPPLLAGEER